MYKKRKIPWVTYIVMGGIVCYMGYLMADAYKKAGNILLAYSYFMQNLSHPFYNYWNEYSLKGIAIFLVLYVFFVLYTEAGRRNYMQGREYGSAKLADPMELTKVLADHNDRRPGNIRVGGKR